MVDPVTTKLLIDVAKISKNAGEKLYSKVKAANKDKKIKSSIQLGEAFEEYLTYSANKNNKIKTLLFRHDPKPLCSFYEPSGVKLGNKVIDTNNVSNVLEVGSKIIVSGTGGIGKTVMMKHFFINSISELKLIPVLFELRSLNTKVANEIRLEDEIYSFLTSMHFRLEREYFEFSLESGGHLFIFDGFDEVKNENANQVMQEILRFCDKYPNNHFIISSRPSETFISWDGFIELKAQALSKVQALSLIKKLDYDNKVKNSFYKELDEQLYEKYKSFASHPLLLTIMLITFENNSEIPENLNDFYEDAYSALFKRHDATKGYKREILSGLSSEDFKKIFSYFCARTFFKSQYNFNESELLSLIELSIKKVKPSNDTDATKFKDDLIDAVCLMIQDGFDYIFSHRSFQEYFAAIYVRGLSDEMQCKIIQGWLSKNNFFNDNDFVHMLLNLQRDRFFKNVIYPALSELYLEYKQNEFSKIWMVQKIFSASSWETGEDGGAVRGVTVKNTYLYCMISFAKEFTPKSEVVLEKRKGVEAAVKKFKETFPAQKNIPFETIAKESFFSDYIYSLNWIIIDIERAMKSVETYEKSLENTKSDYDSLIDNL